MRLVYVGDGPRDQAMVPALVERVVGPHAAEFHAWHAIRVHGRGYDRKLLWAARSAIRDGADGVVATIDRDTGDPQLSQLERARSRLRADGEALPLAVGEAVPHAEAWLVDDLEPLRRHLDLPATAKRPPGKDPKSELDALITACGTPLRRVEVLALLASSVELARCRHADRNGLRLFLDDVRDQLLRP